MNKLAVGMLLALGLSPLSLTAQEKSQIDRCYLAAIMDVPVAADEIGKLVEVMVGDGDEVEAGQTIAQIDAEDAKMARDVANFKYSAARKQSQNNVSVLAAQAAEGVAKASYDKILEANRKEPGAYTQTEVLRAELEWKRTGLQIDLAKHEMDVARAEAFASYSQLKQADAMIERRKLKAPFGGTVVEVIRETGEWVNAGDPVVHLVQMDRLRVYGSVDADQWHWNDLKNRPVEVTVQLPGGATHVVSGTIGFASPVVESDGYFRVWAEIENSMVGDNWLMGPGLSAMMVVR
jgi:macrolide-specific efflux system membrane fusion protein